MAAGVLPWLLSVAGLLPSPPLFISLSAFIPCMRFVLKRASMCPHKLEVVRKCQWQAGGGMMVVGAWHVTGEGGIVICRLSLLDSFIIFIMKWPETGNYFFMA